MSWARSWTCCRGCGTEAVRHQARGYCRRCYAARNRASSLLRTVGAEIEIEDYREFLQDDAYALRLRLTALLDYLGP